MNKVSIIVPIYNAEKFLDKCINSILNQTYDNYELILVNDGSTDRSKEICSRYCNIEKYDKNAKIKYIFQTNSGVSAARNKGIDVAEGEFITFVDADDYLDEKYLEELIKAQKRNNSDWTLCEFTNIDLETGIRNRKISFTDCVYYKKDDIEKKVIPKTLVNDNMQMIGNPYCKLYKKTLLDQHSIRFNEDLYYHEDRLFNFEYSNHISSFYYMPKSLYNRLMHSKSAIHTFKPDLYVQYKKISKYFKKLVHQYGCMSAAKVKFEILLLISDPINMYIFNPDNKENSSKKIKGYYAFLSESPMSDMLKELNIISPVLNIKDKIKIFIVKTHILFIFYFVLKLKNLLLY